MEFTVTLEIPRSMHKIDKLQGPKTKHFDLDWSLQLQSRNNQLGAYLHCDNPIDSNLWSADVDMEFTIIDSRSGERGATRCTTNCYDKCTFGYGFHAITAWETFMKEHTGGDWDLEMECRVKVTKIVGVAQKQKTCFDRPVTGLTDTIIVIDEREFHVSKAILGTFSSYFRALATGGELNDGEFVLVNQYADVFKLYLDILYQTEAELTDYDVVDLLKTSERFDTALVKNKCEQFLLSSSKKTLKEKLQISEEFKLAELQSHCLKSLKTRADFKRELESSKNLDILSMSAVFDKLISLA